MNNWQKGALAALVAVTGVVSGVHADEASGRKQLQMIYDRVDRAMERKDIDAAMAPTARDYAYKMLDGKALTREQSIALFKERFKSVKTMRRSSTKAGEVSVRGDEATAVVTVNQSFILTDSKGKSHPATYRCRARDFWRKADKGWEMKRTEDIEEELRVNGKRVDGSDPFGEKKPERAK